MAWAWGLEWVWVGGYSAAATTILLTNCMLLVSVIRNRYLHYTFNYVVFALSLRCPPHVRCPHLAMSVCRNILRVVFTLGLVVVAKLSQAGPAPLQVQYSTVQYSTAVPAQPPLTSPPSCPACPPTCPGTRPRRGCARSRPRWTARW